jgi:DNA repair protein RecO (recombination protein O)
VSQPRQTTAFVLRKVDYGDRDVIVTVLGRETGKFSAIAKGARASRKRFGGGLQPMRCLDLSYTHKSNRELAFLREIDLVEDFPDLEADFDRITVASYATELVREVSREAYAEPKIFDLLRQFYRRISEADGGTLALEAMLRHFELGLLELHGALPSLYACFRCDTPAAELETLRCTRGGQGIICAACRRSGEAVGSLSEATHKLLCYYHRPRDKAPDALRRATAVEQARRVVDASFEQLLDRPLKSRPMLDAVLDTIFDD